MFINPTTNSDVYTPEVVRLHGQPDWSTGNSEADELKHAIGSGLETYGEDRVTREHLSGAVEDYNVRDRMQHFFKGVLLIPFGVVFGTLGAAIGVPELGARLPIEEFAAAVTNEPVHYVTCKRAMQACQDFMTCAVTQQQEWSQCD